MWGIIYFINTGNIYLSIGVTALCLMIIVSTAVFMLRKYPENDLGSERKPVLDLAPVTIYKSDLPTALEQEPSLNLYPFISTLTGQWDDIMRGKDITFTFFCDPKIQRPVPIDRQAITSILDRLIGRAAQTTSAGRIHVHVTEKPIPNEQDTCEMPKASPASELEIVIADTGNGRITSKALALDGTVSDFGLQDIQPQLDIISGRIIHKSRLGRGAEFILTIPLKQIGTHSFQHLTLPDMAAMVKLKLESYHSLETEDSVAGLEAQAKIIADREQQTRQDQDTAEDMPVETLSDIISLSSRNKAVSKAAMDGLIESLNGLNVLVAEDNPANRDTVRALLSPLNPNLIYADNGREAITALNTHLFDYIIMDVHMLSLSGIETTQLIRERELGEHHIPIIGLTADSTQNTEQIALAAGMDSLLTKPVTSLALFQAIETSRTNNPHYQAYVDKVRRQRQA